MTEYKAELIQDLETQVQVYVDKIGEFTQDEERIQKERNITKQKINVLTAAISILKNEWIGDDTNV